MASEDPLALAATYNVAATYNETHSHNPDHGTRPVVILFISGSCCIGAFTRTVFKKVPLPYTILLLLFGGMFGVLAHHVHEVAAYAAITELDPHIILHVFLPVLIFESAFVLDVHTFLKSSVQIMTLAIPGFIIATGLTAVFCMYTFNYEGWTWQVAFMFGTVISATDPVAVVALLKELGASRTLGVLIEGESLLNDGAAIVGFNVCIALATGVDMDAGDITLYFMRVALGGPLFGYIMAKLTILWLVNIYNDALTEITITLVSTYITFYIGEEFLKVSGVLAVVALGVTINLERTSISPEVDAFLTRFWEMLAYLANTLIFVIVGVVITKTAGQSTNWRDSGLLLALYCAISVIRLIVIAILSPLLVRTGYGMKWRDAIIMSWGGLRGAICLALALMVQKAHFRDTVKEQVLLHCAGIVLLTLVVNATTIGHLLNALGMREISAPKRMAMAGAVRTLNDTRQHSFNIYKHDKFLADAAWDTVEHCVKIKDPYRTVDEEAELDGLIDLSELDSKRDACNECSKTALDTNPEVTFAADEIAPELLNQMREEARLRLLKAQKTSFVRQFAHGMLSRDAVRKLVECVDIAMDTPGGYIKIDDIKQTWQIKGFFASLKNRLEKWRSEKPDVILVPPPENPFLKICYTIVMHSIFEVFIYFVILSNCVAIFWELIAEYQLCANIFDHIYGDAFFILNMIFYTIYFLEAVVKILGLRPLPYFKSKWNMFDFLILIMSTVDIIVDQTFFYHESIAKHCADSTSTTFSPSLLRVAKSVRLLRILRSLRLVRGIIPQVIDGLNKQINKKIRYGYDVGKGYVMAEEDVSDFITHLIDNDIIRNEIRHLVSNGRLVILKELARLQKDHPGIAVSVKTQQAARRILNNIQQKIEELSREGALDAKECVKLEQVVETQIKKLLAIPALIPPPPPETVLRNLAWANEDMELMQYLNQHAQLVNKMDGETFIHAGDPGEGVYVIISGVVRIEVHPHDDTSQDIRDTTTSRGSDLLANISTLCVADTVVPTAIKKQEANVVVDYLGAGSIIGEVSLLTKQPRTADAICASAVELYLIPFDIIRPALALDDKEPSLAYRLWKVCAIRMGSTILRNHVAYKRWTMDKIKMYLERSLVYVHTQSEDEEMVSPPFEVSAIHMSDVILIHGEVELDNDYSRVVGPCYINNTVKRIHLMSSPTHVILVVPRGSTTFNPLSSDGVLTRTPDALVQASSLCLKHASEKRLWLTNAASASRTLARKSSSRIKTNEGNLSKTRLMNRLMKSKTTGGEVLLIESEESPKENDHVVLDIDAEDAPTQTTTEDMDEMATILEDAPTQTTTEDMDEMATIPEDAPTQTTAMDMDEMATIPEDTRTQTTTEDMDEMATIPEDAPTQTTAMDMDEMATIPEDAPTQTTTEDMDEMATILEDAPTQTTTEDMDEKEVNYITYR